MPDSTSIDKYENMGVIALFDKALVTKGLITTCRTREKDMMRSSRNARYDREMAKKKEKEFDVIVKVLKKKLEQESGKKYFKKSIISIFKREKNLFKRFLLDNYDFSAWSDTYESIVDKRAMKDSDMKMILKLKMYEKYIEYVSNV